MSTTLLHPADVPSRDGLRLTRPRLAALLAAAAAAGTGGGTGLLLATAR
jgi:hypothetical protein